MNVQLLNTLKYAAASSLLISAFVTAIQTTAYAEEISLFRFAESPTRNLGDLSRPIQQKAPLRLDEKGDLLIQYGNIRFSVTYNEPSDQFKPPWQRYTPQREQSTAINGISLTACLTF